MLSLLPEALLHLVYPHICEGCGTDVLDRRHRLCAHCHTRLPRTGFQLLAHNPVEKLFWGRLPLRAATAQFYFTKQSMMQHLLHQLKYKGARELGLYLGGLAGQQLAAAGRFADIDALVPLPLHRARERQRGYNQAALLCAGMAEALEKPVWNDVVVRSEATDTQTRKGRVERWENIEGRFRLTVPAQVEGHRLLLVDDVVTTGATLEACGRALLAAGGVELSLAALCYSTG